MPVWYWHGNRNSRGPSGVNDKDRGRENVEGEAREVRSNILNSQEGWALC